MDGNARINLLLLFAPLTGSWRPVLGRPRFHHEYVERLLTL